jgi:hypothetical protein
MNATNSTDLLQFKIDENIIFFGIFRMINASINLVAEVLIE